MKLTDVFLRRPVLAIVVSVADHRRGLAGDPHAERAPVPQARERDGHRQDRLRRRQRRPGARLHHHAARARHRRRRRHRLHRVAERAGAVDDQRPAEAQLQRRRRARRHQLARQSGPRRPAARGQVPAIQIEPSDAAVRGDVPELQLRRPRGQPGHRLPDPGRPAPAVGDRRRAARGDPRRPHVRPARVAQARPDGGAQRQPRPGAAGAGRQQLPGRGRQTKGALVQLERHRVDRPALAGRVQEARDPRAERRARAPRGRGRRRARRRRLRPGRPLLRARRRCSWASGCCPTPARWTSSAACARRWRRIQRGAAHRACRRSVAFDSTAYIEDAIARGRQDADRDGPHRDRRDLPVPRLAPHGAGAGRRHPGVADRRRVPDAGVRLHAESA